MTYLKTQYPNTALLNYAKTLNEIDTAETNERKNTQSDSVSLLRSRNFTWSSGF